MRYYVVSDVHGFYEPLIAALSRAGYFDDAQPHKLVIAGDLFDRGEEAGKMQAFILDLLERDAVILIRGNHEDLFEELVVYDRGVMLGHHRSNGTYDTALQLTGFDLIRALMSPLAFAEAARQTPYYQTILPAARDYYETEHYIFVHGWIPRAVDSANRLTYMDGWREASEDDWRRARWINGMDAVRTVKEDGKTIVCGHWHTSYGHSRYEGKGSMFGKDADFTPYRAPGILAIDACTAYSGMVNCVVIQEE
ncbi:MAG: metallophosphoesterase [Oscillospiraceae bacterium]|nr:metallophosphoesterase [Oscillospiraceae bacterium]